MKYSFDEGNFIVAKAENIDDNLELMLLQENKVKVPVENSEVESNRPRKYRTQKPCPDCGKKFKGKRGLGLHRWHVHKIPGPHAVEAKFYRDRAKGLVVQTQTPVHQ